MSSDRSRRVDELFLGALEQTPSARASWLDAGCGGDSELRAEVEQLLAAHVVGGGILDGRPPSPRRARSAPETRRIGVYRVIRQIGRGGMGVVYLVERDDGEFRRRAALKLLRGGPDAGDLEERFRAERQILASLDHPNIAQLLDGGATDGHLPYLVMEYVEGLPITEYCDRHGLGIETRLRLFQDVCAAVHHAHRNLVIHRDLKPGNVLVTEQGQVKLLDFGIAKLLNPAMGAFSLPVTRTEVRVMTPEYASPEQHRGDPLSTASDVYALGVLLYELLVGCRPYDLTGRSPSEVSEILYEREPERPSSRVVRASTATSGSGRAAATDARAPESIATARGLSIDRLRHTLRGDLDAIVLMALRKEPGRRYGSADLLAADIQRYLEGLPVLAHHGSRAYRATKFLRRHRSSAIAAGIVAAALVAGAGVALWQASVAGAALVRAEEARRESDAALAQSEEVAGFLMGLFEANDPDEALGGLITARDLLRRGEAHADQLAGQPLVQARMFEVIGHVYRTLGEYERARPLLERALALREQQLGERGLDVAASHAELGELKLESGELAAARTHFETMLEIVGSGSPPDERKLIRGTIGLGDVRQGLGAYEAAETHYRDALARQTSLLGEGDPEIIRTEAKVAIALHNQGEYDAAEEILIRTLERRKQVFGEDHTEVARNLIELAGVHAARDDRFDVAEQLHREALAIRQRVYGDDHPAVARSKLYVAGMLTFQGRFDEAEPLIREGREQQIRLLGPRHPEIATSTSSLAVLLLNTGRPDEAEPLFRETIEIYRETLGDQHHFVAAMIGNLGRVALARGDLEGAEAAHREALRRRRSALGADHPFTSSSLRSLASVLVRRRAFSEAETLYQEALSSYERRPDTADEIAAVSQELVALYQAWGRPEEAAPYVRAPEP